MTSTRSFSAAGNNRRGFATTRSQNFATLLDAVDTAITDALAETDIDASVTAEAAVALIQTATDAVRAEVDASVSAGGYHVTVFIDGAPTQNQIRQALENILKNISRSSEYAQG